MKEKLQKIISLLQRVKKGYKICIINITLDNVIFSERRRIEALNKGICDANLCTYSMREKTFHFVPFCTEEKQKAENLYSISILLSYAFHEMISCFFVDGFHEERQLVELNFLHIFRSIFSNKLTTMFRLNCPFLGVFHQDSVSIKILFTLSHSMKEKKRKKATSEGKLSSLIAYLM